MEGKITDPVILQMHVHYLPPVLSCGCSFHAFTCTVACESSCESTRTSLDFLFMCIIFMDGVKQNFREHL